MKPSVNLEVRPEVKLAVKPGVLVVSHGSREADWVRLVDDAVAACSALMGSEVPVVSAFLELVEGRLIQDGVNALEAEDVTDLYVLPLFVSSGSTHVDDIAQAFGMAPVSATRAGELEPFAVREGMRVRFGAPIDDDGDIAELLLRNIEGLSSEAAWELGAAREGALGAGAEPVRRRERLLLVAHGSREAVFHGRWRDGMAALAERVRELGGFAGAHSAMLLPNQAACKLGALQRRYPDDAFIVVPLFLSEGFFTRTVIPTRLAGLNYRYNGRALLPSPQIARWMERQIREWLRDLDDIDKMDDMGSAGSGSLGS
ncbi:sirohydrochlorin ferrochelatase [Paenibacillus taihuensis]|uniref:Sirohydrochlorin ferrochelatase n=1 Tax=Paenibacillus taihuensis TaxID=1156355 RepID=A0A3D9SBE1_9BACL|nr:CbiX/SirB N-terminal domain-containing protein [Paenibacillus taihuensis]REE90604.1 sirohydrochlorin ferrochelatase [Paenibacillus taihuensis]